MGLNKGSRKRDPLYGPELALARLDAVLNTVIVLALLGSCIAAYLVHY